MAHLSKQLPQQPLHTNTELGSAPCQGRAADSCGRTGSGKEHGALKKHYLGVFRLIGVNCLGRLENSTANGSVDAG